ncbi:MAG: hypothetical protein ACOH5I_12525 [Oligoflexus sp.]
MMESVPSSQMTNKLKPKYRPWMLLRVRGNGVIAPSAMLKIAKEIDAKRKQTGQPSLEENMRVS